MNLKEIKQKAVKEALKNAILSAHEIQIEVLEKLGRMDNYNYDRYKHDFVAKFHEAEQTIDEAFCELHDPKPTAQ